MRDRLLADLDYQLTTANVAMQAMVNQFSGGGIRGMLGMLGGPKDG